MRKILSLLLIVLLVMTCACSRSEEKEPKNETTTTAVEENPFEEFFEITWLTEENADYIEGRWDETELEEMFNIDLNCWPIDSRNAEQMAALVAAGDIPDFFFMPACPRSPEDMYKEQLTRSIHIDMIRNYLPGYYALLERLPVGFKYNLVEGKDDEYLGLTHVNISGCQYFYDATCVNLDWLEAVGYGIDPSRLTPVKMTVEGYEKFNDNIYFTEGNMSFDDLLDIMKKFTEDDPDGNGQDDTYGMMYLDYDATVNMSQYGLFGFVEDQNYLYKDPATGNVVPYYAYTPFKDYLKWISDMLQKGYMRKLPGIDYWYTEYQQVSLTNRVGIMQINGGGYLNLNSDAYRVLPPQNILLNTDENARFVIGPMFRGPNGVAVNKTYNIDPFGTGTWRVQMVGSQVSDAELERILRLLQYTVFSSQDIYLRYQYGIEGIHWKWAGEPYVSNRISTPRADLPEQYRGKTNVFTLFVYPSVVQQQIDNAVNNGYWAYMPYMHAHGLFEKYALNPEKYRSEVYMGRELYQIFLEINDEVGSEISTVFYDFKQRVIEGEIADINSEWSQYIDQLYAAGLQRLVDEIYNNPAFEKYDPGDKFKMKE